jgi:hypothetical protein
MFKRLSLGDMILENITLQQTPLVIENNQESKLTFPGFVEQV